MSTSKIPKVGNRTTLAPSISSFLKHNPSLHLGGADAFTDERRHHTEVFGIHALPKEKVHPIHEVEFTAVRGPHGTIPVRVLYPKSGEERRKKGEAAALVYFHGGGYTVGTVDEFENGLRQLAEESGVQIYAIDYRPAPEFAHPMQLDEYDAIISWLRSSEGKSRGVSSSLICGGGDSAGGNMTAALCLRRQDHKLPPLAAQILLYPEARLPFDTPAASENNSALYLECNGIFSFAYHYLPRGIPPAHRYIPPGMQEIKDLKGQPKAVVCTAGFDPLRDVGVEYARKLEEAGDVVVWRHFERLTHGWLQMGPWSEEAENAIKDLAREVKKLVYGYITGPGEKSMYLSWLMFRPLEPFSKTIKCSQSASSI